MPQNSDIKPNPNPNWSHLFSIQRNGVDERTIFGSVAISYGITLLTTPCNPHCYGRSLMKPFQMKPLTTCLDAQTDLSQKAISMASHMGFSDQMAVVESLLKDTRSADLKLPETTPMGAPNDHTRKSKLSHPCSGKHLAILKACEIMNWDKATYLDVAHPYNDLYKKDLEQRLNINLSEYTLAADGCGLPTWAIPLSKTAQLFQQLAEEKDHDWIWSAFRKHPELIGGAGRLDTELMEQSDRLLAKEGADGLLGVSISGAESMGIVIKIAHGFDPAMAAQVIYPVLNKLNVVTKKAPEFYGQKVVLSKHLNDLLDALPLHR